MNVKRLIALSLVLIMVCTTAFTAIAGTFSDTAGHWAEAEIEEMSKVGLIKGYPDGTFGPSNPVSNWETLILASRVMGFNDEDNKRFIDLAEQNYISMLDGYNVSNKAELCYLLYWDVIKSADLDGYLSDTRKNTPTLRHEAAILLTKAMGGEKEALSQLVVSSDFDDESDIPAASRPYVAYVSKHGIMQGTGDNMFSPLLGVSRAQIATMMYRVMRAMSLTKNSYTVIQRIESNKTLNTVSADTGAAVKVAVPDDVMVRVDGAIGAYDDIIVGMEIRTTSQGSGPRIIEATSDVTTQMMEGPVTNVSTSGGDKLTIEVTDEYGETEKYSFTANTSTMITIDGKTSTFNQLKASLYAKVYYTGGSAAYKIEAESRTSRIEGTLKEITIDPSTMVLVLSNGDEETYEILDSCGIIRNDKAATIRDVAAGDFISATLDMKKVKEIRAKSSNSSLEGVIKNIAFGDYNTLTIKVGSENVTVNITSETKIYIDGRQSTMYDLRLNTQARIDVASNNALRIDSYAVAAVPQITGIVKNVSALHGIVTIEDIGSAEGGEKQVYIKSNCTFVDNTSNKIASIQKLTVGRTVICLGIMVNGVYEVNTLIVTN